MMYGRRRRERLRRREQHARLLLGVELLDQPRLADARLADQLDQRAVALPPRPRAPSRSSTSSLSRPINGSCTLASRVRDPSTSPTRPRLDRLRLPLDHERLELVVANRVPRRVEHLGGREDLAGGRLRHQAGGEVHRVAHHRVRPPVPRPDVAGEHRAPVHADPDRDRALACRRSCGARAASAPRRCR